MRETVSLAIFALILTVNLIVATYVLVQRPRHLVHRSFFAIVLGIFFWGTGFLLSESGCCSELFIPFILYGGITFIASFAVFSRVVPHGDTPPRRFWLWFIPMGIAAVLLPFNLFIRSASVVGGVVKPVNGPLFPVFAVVCMSYMLYGILRLRITYRLSEPAERHRLKYFFLGFGSFIAIALVFDVFLPSLGFFSLNILGPMASILLVIATAYGIVRHNIMDIKIVIQRGLIYTVLATILVATYLVLVLVSGTLLHAEGEHAVVISAGIAVLIGVFGVSPLERYFGRITDAWFFKDRYDYGEALHKLSRIANTNVSQHLIVERSEQALCEIFKAEHVEILMGTIHPPRLTGPSVRHTEVCVPLVFEDTRIGLLIVGRKRSGDSYTSDDIRLIETFSYQAAVALEKARLYEEVREYSQTLEHQVAERTRKIHDLLEDQKQSMSDISHSLQTPLAVLSNQIELLEETSGDSLILSTCRRSISSVSQFIRRLLHLVTLESKYGQDSLVRMNLGVLLENDVEYFATMAEAEEIELSAEILHDAPIIGNAELIEELVMNLVTNAIKYSRSGNERVIRISLTEEENVIVLRVSDNGIGIPEHDLESIFKRFYRARQKDSSASGNGLGLAICKRIADMHGATIHVTSVLDQGTMFLVEFPRA